MENATLIIGLKKIKHAMLSRPALIGGLCSWNLQVNTSETYVEVSRYLNRHLPWKSQKDVFCWHISDVKSRTEWLHTHIKKLENE